METNGIDDIGVVIVRLNNGDELIAIIARAFDDRVQLKNPHYIEYNFDSAMLMLMPYCSLSDEEYYVIKRDRIEFIVTANQMVATKFVRSLIENKGQINNPYKVKPKPQPKASEEDEPSGTIH